MLGTLALVLGFGASVRAVFLLADRRPGRSLAALVVSAVAMETAVLCFWPSLWLLVW